MNLVRSVKGLFSRLNFEPEDSSKITLFANRAEAIVFWLCISGLVFLGIIVLFRYLTAKNITGDHKSLQAVQQELRMEVDSLRSQNQMLAQQMEDMQVRLQRATARHDSMIIQLQRRPAPSAAVVRPNQGTVARDGRSTMLKSLFGIESRPARQTAVK